jgi:hypothetical protein
MVPDRQLQEVVFSIFAHQLRTMMVGKLEYDSIADRRASSVTGA